MILKLNEKNKLSSAVLLILLILIIVGVLSFMIFGLRHFDLIKFPAFIEKFFLKSDNIAIPIKNNNGDIYNFLENDSYLRAANGESENTENIYAFDITLENIKEVLADIVFPENIYVESTAKYYYKNSALKTIETSLWKRGEKFRYSIKTNSHADKLYINDGVTEYIEDYSTGNNITRATGELFSFSAVPNIQDINYYIGLLESSEIVSYATVYNNDESLARIRYEIPELNQSELIYVSLDTGIVLSVSSYYDDGSGRKLYYEYTATVKEAYNEISQVSKTEISDKLFEIPK